MKVEESYGWMTLAANASGQILGAGGGDVGGFLCTVAGTLKITSTSTGGPAIIDTLTVVASTFYPMPLCIPPSVATFITLAGGAAGTLFLNM